MSEVEADAIARQKAEDEVREKDKKHRQGVNSTALAHLGTEAGLSFEDARKVIGAIAAGKIPGVRMVY